MKVCITGTPGTGKSEVAKLLAERLGWELVELNRLAEEKELYSGYDKKRGCKIVDLKRIKLEIESIKKQNLIIESHYSHDIPSDLIIVLRCNPKELRKRLGTKGWGKEKIEENVEAEIMEVCKSEALENCKNVFEVDTTGKNGMEVVDEIFDMLCKFIKTWDKKNKG